jgi:hypothetical protein
MIGKVNFNWEEAEYEDPETGETVLGWNRYDERYYYIKDHLGNIRITIDQNGETVSA